MAQYHVFWSNFRDILYFLKLSFCASQNIQKTFLFFLLIEKYVFSFNYFSQYTYPYSDIDSPKKSALKTLF